MLVSNSGEQVSSTLYNKCAAAAVQCKMLKNASDGSDPCVVCAKSCVTTSGAPIFVTGNGVTAAECCNKTNVSAIFEGTTYC
jgi:hypothetical protein